MNTLAIIQARTGATRLPNKVLLKLEDKCVLEHVINRVKKSSLIDEVIVATTININDLKIINFCSERGIRVFCGSENDVLDRFYQAAKLFNPENIVRITADCPMIDPQIIDLVIKTHFDNKADYTSNTLKETFPDGEDIEIFKFNALKKAWIESKLTSEREHVTPYIRNNKELFKLSNVENTINLSDKRWTLDHEEDYKLIQFVYSKLYSKNNYFGMKEILELLKKYPEVEDYNKNIIRNEGYAKSLKEDKKINGE